MMDRFVPDAPVDADRFAAIREVADAALYEGYVLYPYRASATKNTSRWQFGVLMPPSYAAIEPSESDRCVTEVLLQAERGARIQLEVRFLHVRLRTDASGQEWSEADERRVAIVRPLGEFRTSVEHPFTFAAGRTHEGTSSHDVREVAGVVRVRAEDLPGSHGTSRLRVEVRNCSSCEATDRDGALRSALIAVHTMMALDGGRFASLADPPEWARAHVDQCENVGTWPVLGASDDVVLSSPIILGDRPEVAPESQGDLYDATEIDELLTLRTMTLTDDEKAQARATDPRAAAVIDRVDNLPQEYLDRLHGAVRYLRTASGEAPPEFVTPSDEHDAAPWWDPVADASVSPDTDFVVIDGVQVSRGCRVRLKPGARSTDAQDLFLAGRTATVEAVFFDVDGKQHLGVTPDDDPELAEIARWHGRFLYFAPDEVEPVTDLPRSPEATS